MPKLSTARESLTRSERRFAQDIRFDQHRRTMAADNVDGVPVPAEGPLLAA